MKKEWNELVRVLREDPLHGASIKERRDDLESRVDALCDHVMNCDHALTRGPDFSIYSKSFFHIETENELQRHLMFFKEYFIISE